ncbi:MAG: hypothetical protein M1827_001430 [Pycnora praestabilis]|nr:MAG: hypothetical protein M1827_001430 [Pycnora praestabilis]
MPAANQGCMPGTQVTETMSTPGFFTAAILADESQNPFETSFKQGNASIERGKKFGDSQYNEFDGNRHSTYNEHNDTYMRTFRDDGFSSLFNFSSRIQSPASFDQEDNMQRQRSSQFPSDINLQSSAVWNGSKQEKQLHYGQPFANSTQPPSPPQSSDSSPDQWAYNTQPPMLSPLHQLLTENTSAEYLSQYGRITPPKDGSPNSNDPIGAFDLRSTAPSLEQGNLLSDKKRKRGSQTSQSGISESRNPSKRQRQSTSRSKAASTSICQPEAEGLEDAKRSKFLERNRVAASKCRQKKKEWTGNLESRARDLQNNKNQLALMVGSLRDEVLFLKSQLLKHSNCNCSRIRDYLDHEVTNLSRPCSTSFAAASPVQHFDDRKDYEELGVEDRTKLNRVQELTGDGVATSVNGSPQIAGIGSPGEPLSSPGTQIKAETVEHNVMQVLLREELNGGVNREVPILR